MRVEERYRGIIDWFSANVPQADTELHFRNPFQLLIAVMLSAQCTDKRVNMVTPALYEAFPTPEALSAAEVPEVFEYVHSVSYPNSKAEHLVAMARRLVEVFDGKVPDNMDDLQSLQGVGRKTANVMMAVAFGQPAMAVDTHVFRVSERIGLTTGSKTPLQTETALVRRIPRELLGRAHHWLILHGRYVCTARSPKCGECGIAAWCRYDQRAKRKRAAH